MVKHKRVAPAQKLPEASKRSAKGDPALRYCAASAPVGGAVRNRCACGRLHHKADRARSVIGITRCRGARNDHPRCGCRGAGDVNDHVQLKKLIAFGSRWAETWENLRWGRQRITGWPAWERQGGAADIHAANSFESSDLINESPLVLWGGLRHGTEAPNLERVLDLVAQGRPKN